MSAISDLAGFSLDEFIVRQQLPASFAATATDYFLPLAQWVNRQVSTRPGPAFVLGINGAQGAGKSTLAAFLADYLPAQYGYIVAAVSIDDLYLPKAAREALAQTVHPLLATRGVPGTHDPAMGQALIKQLQALGAGESLRLPRFDKLQDDPLPADQWPVVTGPVDVILFEGWCVGSQPVGESTLAEPLNDLEKTRDADGRWRKFVNTQLGGDYQALFAMLDALVFMAVPEFACVCRWRTEQEHKLRAAHAKGDDRGSAPGMNDDQLAEFVQYFERITLHNLAVLPQQADVVLRLGQDHQPIAVDYRG